MRHLDSSANLGRAAVLLVWILVFCAGCVSAAAQSQPALFDIARLEAATPLHPYLSALHDPAQQLTLEDVTAPEWADDFLPVGDAEPNFGVNAGAAWSRFTLTNASAQTQTAVLRLDVPSAGYVDLYTPAANGAVQTLRAGARVPYASRPLPDRLIAFPLELAPGTTQTYYLRVATDFALRLPLTLWPTAVYRTTSAEEAFAWALVVGLVLLLSLYNLLVFFVVRELDHLFLALAGSVSIVTTYLANGFAAPWLGDQTVYYPQLVVAMSSLAAIFYIGLVVSFLNLRRRVRWAFYLLAGIAVMAVGAAVIGVFFSAAIGFGLVLAFTPVLLIVTLIATIIGVRQGYRPAVYFLIAQLLPIGLGFVQSTAILGVVPWAPIFLTSVPTSELLLVVLMSLALADRINTARQEVERVNRALTASEGRLRQYLDALPFFVQVYSPTLDVLFSNQRVAQAEQANATDATHNYLEMLRQAPVQKYGHAVPYPPAELPLLRAARGEIAHADDLALTLPDGERVVEAWAVPLTDEAGKIATIVTAFQDITERRAIEQELASYRDHLEQRVTQRTAELAAVNHALEARIAELSALNDISRTMSVITDLEQALRRVAQILCDLYAVPTASISLFDAPRGGLHVAAMEARGHMALGAYVDHLLPFTPDVSPIFLRREPQVIADIDQVDMLAAEVRADLRAQGVARLLVAPLLARDELLGVITLITDDPAHDFTANDLHVAQTVAGQVAAAIDISRLIDETRQQRDVAEALRTTTNTLTRSLDQDTVLATILYELRQVIDYEGAAIALRADDRLVIAGAEGLSERWRGMEAPVVGSSPLQQVFQTGAPLLIGDTQQGPDASPWLDTAQIRSWLGAPLLAGEKSLGVLYIVSSTAGAFDAAQVALLETFADQAAIAVTNARLYAQAQVAAASSERERIARELHDAVTQLIFSASLIAEALPAQLPDVPTEVQHNLTLLGTLTKGALAELRALLLELRPEHLIATSLERLLMQLGEAFTGRMGTPVQVMANCDALYRPPPDVQVAAYRIAQEALNNVAKHAQAQNVTINLTLRPGLLRLSILDDGRGFDVPAQTHSQLGISIMHARAAEIGAQLTIDSAPGMGTQIFLIWNEAAAAQ